MIGEPGRYICEDTYYVASRIIGAKTSKEGKRLYTVNNGIFTSYTGRVHGVSYEISPLVDQQKLTKRKKFPSTYYGQTCYSGDWILKDHMEYEQKSGEWVISKTMGAYFPELT